MARTQKYTAAEIIRAIENTGGIKDKIARNLGCHRDTVDNYLKRYATVRQAYEAEKEKVLDFAEAKLIDKLDEGFWPAIRYYLSTKGKDRGYVQKQEIDLSAEIQVEQEVVWGEAKPED